MKHFGPNSVAPLVLAALAATAHTAGAAHKPAANQPEDEEDNGQP